MKTFDRFIEKTRQLQFSDKLGFARMCEQVKGRIGKPVNENVQHKINTGANDLELLYIHEFYNIFLTKLKKTKLIYFAKYSDTLELDIIPITGLRIESYSIDGDEDVDDDYLSHLEYQVVLESGPAGKKPVTVGELLSKWQHELDQHKNAAMGLGYSDDYFYDMWSESSYETILEDDLGNQVDQLYAVGWSVGDILDNDNGEIAFIYCNADNNVSTLKAQLLQCVNSTLYIQDAAGEPDVRMVYPFHNKIGFYLKQFAQKTNANNYNMHLAKVKMMLQIIPNLTMEQKLQAVKFFETQHKNINNTPKDPVPFNVPNQQPAETTPEQPVEQDPNKLNIIKLKPNITLQELKNTIGDGIILCAPGKFLNDKPGAFTELEKSIICQGRPIYFQECDFTKTTAKVPKSINWIAYDPAISAYYCSRVYTMLSFKSTVVYRVAGYITIEDMLEIINKKPSSLGIYYNVVKKAEEGSYKNSANGFDVLADSDDFFKKFKNVDKNAQFPFTIGVKVKGKMLSTPAKGNQYNSTYGVKMTATPVLTGLPKADVADANKKKLLDIIKKVDIKFVDIELWTKSDTKVRPECIPNDGKTYIEFMCPGVDQSKNLIGTEALKFLSMYFIDQVGEKLLDIAKQLVDEPTLIVTFRNKNINI